jgi:hypothetical protein
MIPFSPRFTLRPSSFQCANTCNSAGRGTLAGNQENVLKTVIVELRHRGKVGRKSLAVSRFQSCDQRVNAGLNEFLIVLLDSFNNIFKPLFRRVGCFCLSLEAAARQKQIPADTGRNAAEPRVAGRDGSAR